MNAIIRLQKNSSSKKGRFRLFFRPAVESVEATKYDTLIYSLNPFRYKRFPKIISNIRKQCSPVYFTEEMKQYPRVYHGISQEDYLFYHLGTILSKLPKEDLSDIGVFCQKEDPRLIPLLEILSHICVTVSILTEEDAFFETVSKNIFFSHGLTVNQKSPQTMPKKRLLILLNTPLETLSPYGERCIDLRTSPFSSDLPTLFDFTTRDTNDFFQKFHIENIKHCYFVPKEDKNINLIWKISKKS